MLHWKEKREEGIGDIGMHMKSNLYIELPKSEKLTISERVYEALKKIRKTGLFLVVNDRLYKL